MSCPGQLCDAALAQRGSASRLAQLAETTTLLRPLDAARTRYRWHGLVQDALKAWLDRTEPRLGARRCIPARALGTSSTGTPTPR